MYRVLSQNYKLTCTRCTCSLPHSLQASSKIEKELQIILFHIVQMNVCTHSNPVPTPHPKHKPRDVVQILL